MKTKSFKTKWLLGIILTIFLGLSPNLNAQTSFSCQDFQSNDSGWDSGSGSRDATNIDGSSHSYKIDAWEDMQSSNQDFTSYESVDFEFTYYTEDFDNTFDDIRVYFNDGSGEVQIADYDFSVDFNDRTAYNISITVNSTTIGGPYDFTGSNEYFRIYNHALAWDWRNDDLFIDDICLVGTTPSGPEIAISGNGVDISDGDITPDSSDHTDFGSVDYDAGTIVRTFTITNSGTTNLTLTGTPRVAISGSGSSNFSLTSIPSTPIADSGGTTTFQITYDPSAPGTHNATLTITNNDTDEGTYDFSII